MCVHAGAEEGGESVIENFAKEVGGKEKERADRRGLSAKARKKLEQRERYLSQARLLVYLSPG